MNKKYTTVKQLVTEDLAKYSLEAVKAISENTIDRYFSELVQTKGHQAPQPLRLGTVNRYVERYIKANTTNQ